MYPSEMRPAGWGQSIANQVALEHFVFAFDLLVVQWVAASASLREEERVMGCDPSPASTLLRVLF